MNRFLPSVAFLAGLAVLGWVAAGYFGAHPLALGVTVLVAAVYTAGAAELRRFRQATQRLESAMQSLQAPPPDLAGWLQTLPATLRDAVRLRVEGERAALPGPALSPYLSGLLVLLGMLGTFLGMVATLKGTGTALEGASDVSSIRAALSAPVQGLGLAFGTSVAGVAASAMLGLMTALSRRERLLASQALDRSIATTLRGFSKARRREEHFELLQRQAEAVPALVEQVAAMIQEQRQQTQALIQEQRQQSQTLVQALHQQSQALAGSLQEQSQALGASVQQQARALAETLSSNQQAFHAEAARTHAGLAASVEASLNRTLAESARTATASIEPAVQRAMEGIARETTNLQQALASSVEKHLQGAGARLDASVELISEGWRQALDQQGRQQQALLESLQQQAVSTGAGLQSSATEMARAWQQALQGHEQGHAERMASLDSHLARQAAEIESRAVAFAAELAERQAAQQQESAAREAERLARWTETLQSVSTSLREDWQRSGEATLARQQQICGTLEETARAMGEQAQAHARETLGEIARLVQTASEAPRAAAGVIAELRQQLSQSMVRDNEMLEERAELLKTLGTLLETLRHASTEQRSAIDALVASSSSLLQEAGERFCEKLQDQAEGLASASAEVAAGAAEVGALGEVFSGAVDSFGASNDKLLQQLQRIEAALGQSLARSDEQLAYYVAQAREIIDLSIMSQRQVVEDLQRLSSRPEAAEA